MRFPVYSILTLLAGATCLATGVYSVVTYATRPTHEAGGPPFLITTALAVAAFFGTIALANRANSRFEQGRVPRGCGCLLAVLGVCFVFALAYILNVGDCPTQQFRCRP